MSATPKEMADIFKKIAVLGDQPPPEQEWATLSKQAQQINEQEFARYTEYSLPHMPRPLKVLLVQWLMDKQGYTTLGLRGLSDYVDVALQGRKSKGHLLLRAWLPASVVVTQAFTKEFVEDLASVNLQRGALFTFARFEEKLQTVRLPNLKVDSLDSLDIYRLLQKHLPPRPPPPTTPASPVILHQVQPPPAPPIILRERKDPELIREQPVPQPIAPHAAPPAPVAPHAPPPDLPPATSAAPVAAPEAPQAEKPAAPPPPVSPAPSQMQAELADLLCLWPELTPRDREEVLEIVRLKIRLGSPAK